MEALKTQLKFVFFALLCHFSFSIPLNVTKERKLGQIPSDPLIKNIVKYYNSIEEKVGKQQQTSEDPDLLHEHWLGDISKILGVEESVCGSTDERVPVAPPTTETQHYQWTCWLKIYAPKNAGRGYWTGTGFILDVPGIPGSIMLTSAHCIWLGSYYGGKASKIVINCPGYDAIEVLTSDLHADPGYVTGSSPDHDIGAIYLKEKFDERDGGVHLSKTGFPWTNAMTSGEILTKQMETCGYPGDKLPGTMWKIDGAIESVSDSRIFYMADTYGGQSGSPVYVDIGDGAKTVLAVHGYGGCPNSAVRLTREHLTPILEHVKYRGLSVGLKSSFVPNAFLRANGHSQLVNAQFGCYKNGAETFDVIPVQVTADAVKVALSPRAWPTMAIAAKVKGNNCSVKLSKNIGSDDTIFTLVQNSANETYSFVHERRIGDHFYLQMIADDVTTWQEHGGGIVRCRKERAVEDHFDILSKDKCIL